MNHSLQLFLTIITVLFISCWNNLSEYTVPEATGVNEPPCVIFYPADSAENIPRDVTITIMLERPVRIIYGSELTASDAARLVTLTENDPTGHSVDFTAAVNAEKTVITVSPAVILDWGRKYHVSIGATLEDYSGAVIAPSHASFKTAIEPDTVPPVAALIPADSAPGVPVSADIIIKFSEPVRFLDNSEITSLNAADLIVFKEEDKGTDVSFISEINYDKTVITVRPDPDLKFNHDYYFELKAGAEDFYDNPSAPARSNFRTLLIVINEVLYDSAGSDSSVKDNFIELYGMPGLALDGWKLICYNAPAGEYLTVDLCGRVMPPDGFFVVSEANTVPEYDMVINGLELQNGPDSIRLLNSSGETADTLGYAGSDSSGQYFYFEMSPAPASGGGKSLSRGPGRPDTNDNSADFIITENPTPGY